MNRVLVRELGLAGLLRRAYFLRDIPSDSSQGKIEDHPPPEVASLSSDYPRFLRQIIAQSLRYPNDVWLATHVNYAQIQIITNLMRPSRAGVMIHASELDEAFSTIKYFALKRAGFVMAVSEYSKRKAVKLGIRPERIHVVTNGIEDPCPDWLPSTVSQVNSTVLFVGRMDERYKGQMELLDSMALLRNQISGLKLVFVGGGKLLSYWRHEADKRGVSHLVEFAGRVSDFELHRHYQEASVFAMTSENEGFGLVYAEAMAHGLPCIGSDRDASREVIAQGVSGFCVPSGNSTALADAIQTLMGSPAQSRAMGKAGRQRFTDHFTIKHYRTRLIAAMEEWLLSV